MRMPIQITNEFRAVVAALLLTAIPFTARAQDGGPTREQIEAARKRAADAMAPIKWMVGEWEGPASRNWAPGQTIRLTQREYVQEVSFGTAMFVEGRGTMPVQGSDRLVFNAAGLFSYDIAKGQYFLASTGGSGHVGVHEITVDGSTVTWYLAEPNGARTRYIIRRTPEGKWHETGEVTRDGGKTWTQNFEMLLTRTK